MANHDFAIAHNDVGMRRSRFENVQHVLTSFNAGFLVPIETWDVLPGSTFQIDASVYMRGSTPIHPVFDDAFIDLFFFWVPARQTFSQWKQMFGEPMDDPYADVPEIIEPGFYASDPEGSGTDPIPGVITRRSLAAYYGVPIGSRPSWVNAKYARGYGLIWNNWFRAQELQQAIDVPLDGIDRLYYRDTDINGVLPDVQVDPDYYINCAKDYGHLAPVCKYHDYFTSALRNPQRGDPASIPLNGIAPVYALDGVQNVFSQAGSFGSWVTNPTLNGATPAGVDIHTSSKHNISGAALGVSGGDMVVNSTALSGTTEKAFFNNLVADLGMAEASSKNIGLAYSTITDLRYAFATQRYLEANNRFGTRYKAFLKAHFDVDANSIELQIPELLGHKKIHIQNNQVVQTSSTDSTTPQGNVAAYSLTSDRDFYFKKSFTEFGVIHCVACVRPNHSYMQGLAKKHSKRTKWDYYSPEFANISELPILRKELYLDGTDSDDQNSPFGFNEAWCEYRVFPSRIGGQFHSAIPDSFDIWHYGDYYDSAPSLSAGWIAETYKNIDRSLAVTSEHADQFKFDIAFKVTHIEPMPLYSIPGIAPYL